MTLPGGAAGLSAVMSNAVKAALAHFYTPDARIARARKNSHPQHICL
jgi:hypothetical protein